MSKSVDEHRREAKRSVTCAIVVTSSTLYKRVQTSEGSGDEAGELIRLRLEENGHRVLSKVIVPNEWDSIRQAVLKAVNELKANVVFTTGGTGLSKGDITVEVVESLLEKKMPGFGELLRFLSYERVGAAAMLSRATAGVVGKTVVFSLPGSPHAVKLALDSLILPEIGHIVSQAEKQPT